MQPILITLVTLVDQVEELKQNTHQELMQEGLEQQGKVMLGVTVPLTLMVIFTIQEQVEGLVL